MVRHFDLMFIQQSVGKLSSQVRILQAKYDYPLILD
jgi:hypothetical protein